MCGRFVITGDPFGIGFKDNFNITPGTKIPIKTLDSDGELKTWSYSPLWKTDMNLINCRYETMNLKPSFKKAKRCIIPFSGWYEWTNVEGKKVPYYHYTDISYFAGLSNESGCLIVTQKSIGKNSVIHERQPGLVSNNNLSDWLMHGFLDDTISDFGINFYKVSNIVNNPINNNKTLIEEQ